MFEVRKLNFVYAKYAQNHFLRTVCPIPSSTQYTCFTSKANNFTRLKKKTLFNFYFLFQYYNFDNLKL